MPKLARIITAAVLGVALTLGAGLPAEAAPAAKRQTVQLIATMSTKATVTWSGNGIVEQKARTGTWKRTFTKQSYTYYSVQVAAFTFSSTENAIVTCKIKVNGKVIRSKKANGGVGYVNCSYTAR